MSVFSGAKGGSKVGIDIGSSLVKVIECRPSGDGVQITALGAAPTPPGTIDNEIVVDPQTLAATIRQLLSEKGISTKQCISSVSGQSSVIVRIIEVPKMTRQELAETMKWEVERHVPFSASEVIMDFEPIERSTSTADDQNMEVLLAVAQQEVISSHLEAIMAAGLRPEAIDVESLAACRSLIDAEEQGIVPGKVSVILNIGAQTTELGVYNEGLLAFPRTIPMAGDAITRALSENLGIALEDAEYLKRQRAEVLVDRVIQAMPALGISGGASLGMPEEMTSEPETVSEPPQMAAMPGTPPADETAVPSFDLDFGQPEPENAGPRRLDFDAEPEPGLSEASAAPEPPAAAEPSAESEIPGAAEVPAEGAIEPEASAEGVPPLGGESDAAQPVPHIDLSAWEESTEKPSLDSHTVEELSDAMSTVLTDLVGEIRRSLEYYTGRFRNQPDEVFLCGGTAKLKGLDQLLQSELGIQVVTANPLKNENVNTGSLSPDFVDEIGPLFPVSLGLAIRDMIGD